MKIFFVLCDRGYSQGAVPVSDVYLIGDDGVTERVLMALRHMPAGDAERLADWYDGLGVEVWDRSPADVPPPATPKAPPGPGERWRSTFPAGEASVAETPCLPCG